MIANEDGEKAIISSINRRLVRVMIEVDVEKIHELEGEVSAGSHATALCRHIT
jgi:hypothetical protein